MKATAKDLRFYSKELLEAVARGEEVVITYRGKPLAKLVPLAKAENRDDRGIELFGIWRDYEAATEVDAFVRNLRQRRF